MLMIRRADERGHANHGWLDSWHTFSFADYYDPRFMGFRALRVINEDRIAGGGGFPTHGHRDMEIITYVIEGALDHKDNLGTASTIRPGEVQRMSAGRGILHSEFNHSDQLPCHLLQIWLLPSSSGFPASYEQKDFSDLLRQPGLHRVVSGAPSDSTITIHQDVDLYVGKLNNLESQFAIRPGRHLWLQMVKGEISLKEKGINLRPGDGLAVSDEKELKLRADGPAEFLMFDLP